MSRLSGNVNVFEKSIILLHLICIAASAFVIRLSLTYLWLAIILYSAAMLSLFAVVFYYLFTTRLSQYTILFSLFFLTNLGQIFLILHWPGADMLLLSEIVCRFLGFFILLYSLCTHTSSSIYLPLLYVICMCIIGAQNLQFIAIFWRHDIHLPYQLMKVWLPCAMLFSIAVIALRYTFLTKGDKGIFAMYFIANFTALLT